MNRTPRAVLFDLDGTLLDSLGGLTAGVNAARGRLSQRALAAAEVAPHISHGLGHLLRSTIPGLGDADLVTARAAFIAHYRAHLLDDLRPHRGAEAALQAWAGRSALVTNKPAMFLGEQLEAMGWRFTAVIDGDHPAGRKPDAAPLLAAAARLGVSPVEAVFVGDSDVDHQAAVAAGMPFCAVAWGHVSDPRVPRVSDLAEVARWR